MPKYDLQCAACAHLWEHQRGMHQPNPPCPQCGSARVTQLPHRTSFSLKGGGWAASGYSKGSR
jgi:putative FmdB family regulatory protein